MYRKPPAKTLKKFDKLWEQVSNQSTPIKQKPISSARARALIRKAWDKTHNESIP